MTIYEMSKEQIIETAEKIAKKTGCRLLGLWTDLKHPYRRTLILIADIDWREYSKLAYRVLNGMSDINGNQIMTSNERYTDGYESCELDVTNDSGYFNNMINTCKGVNWIG